MQYAYYIPHGVDYVIVDTGISKHILYFLMAYALTTYDKIEYGNNLLDNILL